MSDERFKTWWNDSGMYLLSAFHPHVIAEEAWQAAIHTERERCAKIAESTPDLVVGITKSVQGRIAEAIRRGEGV